MPKLNTKHQNAEIMMFSDFSGGLNFARPPEFIQNNEMQTCTNFEFDPSTGALQVRGGIMPIYTFEDDVLDIIPIIGTDHLLVRLKNNIVYRLEGNVAVNVGTITGTRSASYEYWGDNEILIVAGRRLHIYRNSILTTIAEAPGASENADTVMVKNGRVVIGETVTDSLRFSGVGDAEYWEADGTDAGSFSIEIGYKDSLDMSAVAPIAGEIVIFKSAANQPENGRIYRLQGNYPDLNVVMHSKGSSAWNANSVATVANDLLFLTREGLASMQTVTEFGDYKMHWAGAKINPRLAVTLTDSCRLFNIPSKAQVWVWAGGNTSDIWAYHYQIGQGGAWTILSFPGIVRAAVDFIGRRYLGIGNKVYIMSDQLVNDDGLPIAATWNPVSIIRKNQVLVKYIMAVYTSTMTSTTNLKVDALTLPLESDQDDIVSECMNIAATDTTPLTFSGSSVLRRRTNIRKWKITPEVSSTNGNFSLLSVGLEIAEV